MIEALATSWNLEKQNSVKYASRAQFPISSIFELICMKFWLNLYCKIYGLLKLKFYTNQYIGA